MIETKCSLCDCKIVATEDDDAPMCEKCQGIWNESLIVQWALDGDYDHLKDDLLKGGGEDE